MPFTAELTPSTSANVPSQNERPSATAIASTEVAVVSRPMAKPLMIFVAGPVREASAISFTGRQLPDV